MILSYVSLKAYINYGTLPIKAVNCIGFELT